MNVFFWNSPKLCFEDIGDGSVWHLFRKKCQTEPSPMSSLCAEDLNYGIGFLGNVGELSLEAFVIQDAFY